jgi:hypothetical protein
VSGRKHYQQSDLNPQVAEDGFDLMDQVLQNF